MKNDIEVIKKSNELFDELTKLPKSFIIDIIVRLITNEVVSYDMVSLAYVKYIEALKRNNMEDYQVLTQIICKAYADEKHMSENIKDGMLFLYEKGQINPTERLKKYLNISE